MPTPIVYRNVRHPLDSKREKWLKGHFGEQATAHTEDVAYGDDPVGAVEAVINRLEIEGDGRVVAVEAGGPEWILISLAEALAERGITLIRQVFLRGEDGRVVVTGQDASGRDILAFDRYDAVEVEIRKALAFRPLG